MKASELRIGNWWSNGEAEHILDTSTFQDFLNEAQCNNGEVDIYPIPLTEEWLLKFGFEKDKYLTLDLGSGTQAKFVSFHEGQLNLMCKSGLMLAKNIEHVHQLQNLYFALTGQELTIKK